MSIKRVTESVPGKVWVAADRKSVITLYEAIIQIFSYKSNHNDR